MARRPRSKVNANTKRLKEVVRFLLGEAPLDGRWFGDDPPKMKSGRPRPFWWRAELRTVAERTLFELWSANERSRKD